MSNAILKSLRNFTAVNQQSNIVKGIEGDYNFILSGTWAGTILVLRRFPDMKSLGKHSGADAQAALADKTAPFTADELIGMYVSNDTDGSFAPITDNATNSITGTLVGGTDNDWDTGDEYSLWYVAGTFTANDDPQFSEPEPDTDLIVITSVWSSGTALVRISQ